MTPLTGIPVVDWFLSVLDAWGYALVFGFTIFENLFVIGSLTPGETVVIAASLLAAQGRLTIAFVWISSVIGTMTGANISYFLGRRAGIVAVEQFVQRISATRMGRVLGIRAENVSEVWDHFHTDGAKTVLLARFAAGVKNFVPAIAGATRMPLFWFELYNLLGALVYTSLMCAIGWFLGENMEYALDVASRITVGGFVVFVVFIISIVYIRRRVKARRTTRDGASDEGDTQQ